MMYHLWQSDDACLDGVGTTDRGMEMGQVLPLG